MAFFFATSHGKNACDGVGGTIKRLVACAGLQRALHNQILNPHQSYDFAKSEIPCLTCFFVDKQQVDVVSKFLTFRYENARQFRGSRKKHQPIPNDDNILMSQISVVEFPVSNLIEDSPASINIEEVIPQKFYACRYENDWYFGIANYVLIENNDVNVKFMHPKGPTSKFSWPSRDHFCYVPAKNLICEVNSPEASTTGRFYIFS